MMASSTRSRPLLRTSALSMPVLPLERMASFRSSHRRQRRRRIRIEIEMQIFVHDAFEHAAVVFQREHPERVGERIPRDVGEILIASHQRAQPGVFELLDAPDLRDDLAVAGKRLFGDGRYRLNVVERAIIVSIVSKNSQRQRWQKTPRYGAPTSSHVISLDRDRGRAADHAAGLDGLRAVFLEQSIEQDQIRRQSPDVHGLRVIESSGRGRRPGPDRRERRRRSC